MIINRTDNDRLHIIEDRLLSEKYAADFFCKHTYKFLYVEKEGKIVSIITKDDVPLLKDGLPSIERYEVLTSDKEISLSQAEKIFRERPYLNRLAVLDYEHNLICEFDNNSLPPKASNIVKNEMALRYVSLFENEIRAYFDEKGWKTVLVLGSKDIYIDFRREFFWLNVRQAEDYTMTDCDVIFNFRYQNQLMRYFCNDNRVLDLYKIVERMAFLKTVQYFNEKDITFYLFRTPSYDTLTCLSPLEQQNKTKHLSQRALILDDNYIREFADKEEQKVLRSGRHLDSFAEDNGWMFVQHDIRSDFINVNNGMRTTVKCPVKPVNSVHLYGSCLMYGFYANDENTISSLLQKNVVCRNMQVYNHGALLGRNLLNMCIGALTTVYRPGDIVVILDIFEDFEDNENHHIIDTSSWFNQKKPTNEVWFLDFPLHCNKYGNRIYAEGIAEHIAARKRNHYSDKREISYIREYEKKPRCIQLFLHTKLPAHEMQKIHQLAVSIGSELIVTDVIGKNIGAEYFLEHKSPYRKRTVILHYGLGFDYHAFPAFHFFIESADMLTISMLKKMSKVMDMQKKRVLLYLGKFPEKTNDVDGGAQLANQLISSMAENCCLDVTFIRKEEEKYYNKDVNKIRYVEYIDPRENKFVRRLKNINTNRSAVLNGEHYDLIIAAHCSKLFGLEEEREIMENAVIFPMMLTKGYERAGEGVLPLYTSLEEKVLNNVDKIITPSIEEQEDIVNDYPNVSHDRIKVIPRGINPVFSPKIRNKCKSHPQLVSIGSFKLQKNHIDELDVLMKLKQAGLGHTHLTIIGAIHDHDVFDELLQTIEKNDLSDMVTIYSNLSRRHVADLLEDMDISISCSKWETFGRGIFECMTVGLPSVLSDSLRVIKRYSRTEKNVHFFDNTTAMAECIKRLCLDDDTYRRSSEASFRVGQKVSFSQEREALITQLLYRKFSVSTPYMDWDIKKAIPIYSGAYSECYRMGSRVRKYFRYPEVEKIRAEFNAQKYAYENGINSAKPLFISIDKQKNSWFIESSYVDISPAENKTPIDIIYEINMILNKMKKIPFGELRSFSYFYDEMLDALNYFSKKNHINVTEERQQLDSLECCCFVHGDLLFKNLGIHEDKVYVFDFQNSCYGPADWDEAYILSEYTPDILYFHISNEKKMLILLILKIRIGRAIRRKEDTTELDRRLIAWSKI